MKVLSSSAIPKTLKTQFLRLAKIFKSRGKDFKRVLKEIQIVEAIKDEDLPFVEVTVERNNYYHKVWLDPGTGETYCSCPLYRKLKTCHHALKVALLYEVRKLKWKTIRT